HCYNHYFCQSYTCNDITPTHIYHISLHDALPIYSIIQIKTKLSSAMHLVLYRSERYIHCNTVFVIKDHFCSGSIMNWKNICNMRSEEHTSELQSRFDLVCRLLLEKYNNTYQLLMS